MENTTPKHGGGPKTEEGKRIVSTNAIRHGLLSKQVLIKDEEAPVLEELRQDLMNEVAPVGVLESFLADRIIADMWRMRRALAVERRDAVIAQEKIKDDPADAFTYGSEKGFQAALEAPRLTKDLERVIRYLTAIERSFFRALHELQRLQALRQGVPVQPPVVLDVDIHGPQAD
jgi:hypothetical protein